MVCAMFRRTSSMSNPGAHRDVGIPLIIARPATLVDMQKSPGNNNVLEADDIQTCATLLWLILALSSHVGEE